MFRSSILYQRRFQESHMVICCHRRWFASHTISRKILDSVRKNSLALQQNVTNHCAKSNFCYLLSHMHQEITPLVIIFQVSQCQCQAEGYHQWRQVKNDDFRFPMRDKGVGLGNKVHDVHVQ